MNRLWSLAFIVGLWTPCAGCGGSAAPNYPTATLAGNVTVDGQPVNSGKAMFMPVDGGRGTGVVAEIREGKYEARFVPRGKMMVTFNCVQETGKMVKSLSSDVPQPERVDLIPAKYRSGIPVEVSEDKPDQDFVL